MSLRCCLCLLLLFITRLPGTANDKYLYLHEKEARHIHFSLPLIDHIHFRLPDSTLSAIAGPGVAIGVSYSYSQGRYITVEAGGIVKAFLFERAKDTVFNMRTSSAAGYIAIRNNHVLGRINAGYGFALTSFSHRSGYFRDLPEADSAVSRYSNKGLALSFVAGYRFLHFLSAGIGYQPQVYSLTDGFNYGHLVTTQVTLTAPLKKRKGWAKQMR